MGFCSDFCFSLMKIGVGPLRVPTPGDWKQMPAYLRAVRSGCQPQGTGSRCPTPGDRKQMSAYLRAGWLRVPTPGDRKQVPAYLLGIQLLAGSLASSQVSFEPQFVLLTFQSHPDGRKDGVCTLDCFTDPSAEGHTTVRRAGSKRRSRPQLYRNSSAAFSSLWFFM